MRNFIARRLLRITNKRYGYDTTYLEVMLEQSPSAFFKFASAAKAANYRQVVPVEAFFAAKLVAATAEDCGPCTQLVVNMALEAKMAQDQIEAVLRSDIRAMTPEVALAFAFADAVAKRAPDADTHRDAVRGRWGEKGVIDLAMALQMSRTFSMIKLALGYARECHRVSVAGHNVDVVRHAV
jgi:alkylhydroperoxidase family enzyme